MLIQYASDTAVGLYAEKLSVQIRAEPTESGGKLIVFDLITSDPAGRGAIHASEAEARKLLTDLNAALAPKLQAVKPSK